jgi:hypothetical protein
MTTIAKTVKIRSVVHVKINLIIPSTYYNFIPLIENISPKSDIYKNYLQLFSVCTFFASERHVHHTIMSFDITRQCDQNLAENFLCLQKFHARLCLEAHGCLFLVGLKVHSELRVICYCQLRMGNKTVLHGQ